MQTFRNLQMMERLQNLLRKYEIADMVTLKASDDASAEDSKDATDDAETDKTEEK